MTSKTYRAAISQYHAGQHIETTAGAVRQGRSLVVWIERLDRSDMTRTRDERRCRDIAGAERWIQAQGVRLDGQGFYIVAA